MKRLLGVAAFTMLFLAISLASGWTMDFARMSNKQLFELQGAIQNAPEADRNAYQLEWDKRLAAMGDEEKQLYVRPAEEEDGDKLPEPKIPARGYEKDEQGLVIFGGFPENSGASQ